MVQLYTDFADVSEDSRMGPHADKLDMVQQSYSERARSSTYERLEYLTLPSCPNYVFFSIDTRNVSSIENAQGMSKLIS